jgi:hypothetical protein
VLQGLKSSGVFSHDLPIFRLVDPHENYAYYRNLHSKARGIPFLMPLNQSGNLSECLKFDRGFAKSRLLILQASLAALCHAATALLAILTRLTIMGGDSSHSTQDLNIEKGQQASTTPTPSICSDSSNRALVWHLFPAGRSRDSSDRTQDLDIEKGQPTPETPAPST